MDFININSLNFSKPKENNCIEYKESSNNLSRSFWDTYSSFANTKGGVVVLGIKEKNSRQKYEVIGVNNSDKIISDIFNTVNNPQKVSYNLLDDSDVEKIEIDDKVIIQIKIKEAPREKKPVYIDNNRSKSYIRTDDGDRKLTDEKFKYLVVDSQNEVDAELLDNYDMEDINLESVIEYRNLLVTNTGRKELLELNEYDFLCNLGVFKRDRNASEKVYKLTSGGLLFFGKYNSITDRFKKFQLDYFKKNSSLDTDWNDRVSSGDMNFPEMNIFSFYQIVIKKLELNVPDKYRQTQELTRGSYRSDLLLAWKEALVNSLMHAYFDFERPIKITDFEDYVEFFNPGDMRVSTEEFIHGSYSVTRNPIISTLFRKVGIAEKGGSGGPRIFDAASKNHLKYPDIISDFDSTTIQIWKIDMLNSLKDLSIDEEIVVKLAMDKTRIKIKDIVAERDDITDYKARKIIDNLVDKNILIKSGNGKATSYSLDTTQEAALIGIKRMLKSIETDLYRKSSK